METFVNMYVNKSTLFDLYWKQLKTRQDISKLLNIDPHKVTKLLTEFSIPKRGKNDSVGRWIEYSKGYLTWKMSFNGINYLEHRYIVEHELNRKLNANEVIHHRDLNSLNNHPLNLEVLTRKEHDLLHSGEYLSRPPWFYNHMVYAHMLSYMSTCDRLKVGCVITNFDLDQVYAIGFNGNAKTLDNCCDSIESGKCGCIHAENNALIKVGTRDPNKVIFLTHSPCLNCAKLIINSGASWVYYHKKYRDEIPLKLLHACKIRTCPYPINITEGTGGTGFSFYKDYKQIVKEVNI